MARSLRLLMMLVMLMTGLVTALGCGVGQHIRVDANAEHAIAAHAIAAPGDVSAAITSMSDSLCAATHGRGGLLVALARALGAGHAGGDVDPNDELEADDPPDFFDDDSPQGFVMSAFSGLSLRRLAALFVEPNLWGIQSSIGHPQWDEEPPRV